MASYPNKAMQGGFQYEQSERDETNLQAPSAPRRRSIAYIELTPPTPTSSPSQLSRSPLTAPKQQNSAASSQLYHNTDNLPDVVNTYHMNKRKPNLSKQTGIDNNSQYHHNISKDRYANYAPTAPIVQASNSAILYSRDPTKGLDYRNEPKPCIYEYTNSTFSTNKGRRVRSAGQESQERRRSGSHGQDQNTRHRSNSSQGQERRHSGSQGQERRHSGSQGQERRHSGSQGKEQNYQRRSGSQGKDCHNRRSSGSSASHQDNQGSHRRRSGSQGKEHHPQQSRSTHERRRSGSQGRDHHYQYYNTKQRNSTVDQTHEYSNRRRSGSQGKEVYGQTIRRRSGSQGKEFVNSQRGTAAAVSKDTANGNSRQWSRSSQYQYQDTEVPQSFTGKSQYFYNKQYANIDGLSESHGRNNEPFESKQNVMNHGNQDSFYTSPKYNLPISSADLCNTNDKLGVSNASQAVTMPPSLNDSLKVDVAKYNPNSGIIVHGRSTSLGPPQGRRRSYSVCAVLTPESPCTPISPSSVKSTVTIPMLRSPHPSRAASPALFSPPALSPQFASQKIPLMEHMSPTHGNLLSPTSLQKQRGSMPVRVISCPLQTTNPNIPTTQTHVQQQSPNITNQLTLNSHPPASNVHPSILPPHPPVHSKPVTAEQHPASLSQTGPGPIFVNDKLSASNDSPQAAVSISQAGNTFEPRLLMSRRQRRRRSRPSSTCSDESNSRSGSVENLLGGQGPLTVHQQRVQAYNQQQGTITHENTADLQTKNCHTNVKQSNDLSPDKQSNDKKSPTDWATMTEMEFGNKDSLLAPEYAPTIPKVVTSGPTPTIAHSPSVYGYKSAESDLSQEEKEAARKAALDAARMRRRRSRELNTLHSHLNQPQQQQYPVSGGNVSNHEQQIGGSSRQAAPKHQSQRSRRRARSFNAFTTTDNGNLVAPVPDNRVRVRPGSAEGKKTTSPVMKQMPVKPIPTTSQMIQEQQPKRPTSLPVFTNVSSSSDEKESPIKPRPKRRSRRHSKENTSAEKEGENIDNMLDAALDNLRDAKVSDTTRQSYGNDALDKARSRRRMRRRDWIPDHHAIYQSETSEAEIEEEYEKVRRCASDLTSPASSSGRSTPFHDEQQLNQEYEKIKRLLGFNKGEKNDGTKLRPMGNAQSCFDVSKVGMPNDSLQRSESSRNLRDASKDLHINPIDIDNENFEALPACKSKIKTSLSTNNDDSSVGHHDKRLPPVQEEGSDGML